MSAEQITTVVTGIIQSGGLIVFLYFYIRSLKVKISSLQDTINVQKETLSTMEKRISETEKIGDIYRKLMEDLPKDLDNYKAIISKTKDETIIELQKTTEKQEGEICRLRAEVENKIKNLNIREDEIQRSLLIMNRMYREESSDFNQFFQKLELPYEKMIPLIISSSSFEEFLAKAGFAIEVDDNTRNRVTDMITVKNQEISTATFGMHGSYAGICQ